MQDETLDPESVADALLTASRVLVAIAASSLAGVEAELTLGQYRTLVVLQSRGPQPLRHLADELGVVPSSATRMVDRLEAKQLVARRPSSESRREVELVLLPAGAAIVGSVSRVRRRQLRRVVDAMPSAAATALVASLEAFAEAAGEIPEAQWDLGWA